MKRKNTTRNALFTSIISLLLCVSMLVGTTFAWFTDSVVSGNNVIAAGNLDIELYNDGNKVTSQTNLFDGVKWEPGVVDYENFTIENKGNLALLYDFAMNWGDYNTLAGEYNLTQILKVAMVDKHVSGDRAAAIAAGEAAGWKSLSDWSFSGEMTTKGETKDFALIIYWEPSVADNNWNVQNGKTLDKGEYLYVKLGINLQATQKMHEEDSFGKDYDSLANPWDGSVGEVPKADKEGVITITTAAELAAFAAEVNRGNSYSGKTVKLGANINLNNQSWIAIGDCESRKYFQGTFDGQGYTIYNLNVDYSTDASEHATAGLFGWVDAAMATVKNVNIDGATVKGSHWVGVIAGYFTGRIENCSVNNATVIGNNVNDEANGDKVGGIVGYLNEHSYINNNTVSNSTITGNRDIGGIAGSVAASSIEMKNNKVADTTITYSTSKSYASAGEIVSGRTGYVPNDTNTATNVTIVRVINVKTVAELNAALAALSSDALNTAAILQNCNEPSGVVQIPDGYTGTLTLKDSTIASVQAAGAVNLAIEGNVNIQNADGSAITGTEINVSGNGNLTAIAEGNHAYGIGGDETAEINIKDVHIVDVKGGHVKAAITDNNYGKNEPEGGAAIGSGKDGAVITLNNVTIDNAQGGSKAAGIGARFHTGLTVHIQNSTIKNVEGGTSSAGIGGSRMTKHESGDTQNITINITNSRINAKGGDFAAGIGSGYNTYCSGVSPTPVISVTIDADSNITAQGGLLGAGIGTGHNALGFVGNIACDTSNVKAGSSEDPSWCCWGNPTTTAEDVGLGVLSIKNFPDKFGTYVNNADELAAALAAGQDVVLTDDVEMVSATTAPYGNKYAVKLDGGVLDGNGKELHMECYGDDYGIMTTGGTIKNITIQEGCRAVMIMHPKDDVILDNVNIGGEGVLYPINTGEAGANGVDLIVTNSTLAGWTSYGLIESASFTNVKFEQGTYNGDSVYGRVLKPYVNTTLTDCSFVEHMNLDLTALTNGHKITIKNCTVNGQVVNAGVFTIPTTDAQYNTELFTIDLPSWATSINDCVVFQ